MLFDIRDYDSFKAAIEELCVFLSSSKLSQESIFDSKLVAYELLGNVLQHSRGGAKLKAEIDGECIKLRILADEAFVSTKREEKPSVYAERGRGLYLVDQICAEQIITEDGAILVRIRIR